MESLQSEDRAEVEIDRKLPVLFHLLDVSRPRAAKAPVRPLDLARPSAGKVTAEVPEPEFSLAPLPASSPVTQPIFPLPLDHSESLGTSVDRAFLFAGTLGPAATLGDTGAVAPAEEADAQPAEALATPPATTEETPAAPAAVAAAAPQEPVSLPSQRPASRRSKATATDDWFAAHGRFIAVAFVIALVGTVFYARRSPRPATDKDDFARPVAPLIELTSTTDVRSAPAAPPAVEAPPLASTQPPAAATVELHLPVSTSSPASPAAPTPTNSAPALANDERRSGDNLFVFPAPKPGEERVAARTDLPTAESPVSSGAMPPAYPVTSSPALPTNGPVAGQYPQTTYMPPGGTPPVAYQTVPPAGAWSPAGPPLPSIPPATGYGAVPDYQTPDNVARGPRYERTGSGNY